MPYSRYSDPFIRRISLAGISAVVLLLFIIILLVAQLDRLNHLHQVRIVVGDSAAVRQSFNQDTVKLPH